MRRQHHHQQQQQHVAARSSRRRTTSAERPQPRVVDHDTATMTAAAAELEREGRLRRVRSFTMRSGTVVNRGDSFKVSVSAFFVFFRISNTLFDVFELTCQVFVVSAKK